MCTVTYVPTPNGYFLTSNRDENPQRQSALPPKKYLIDNKQLFFPKDPVAGGTWILTDEKRYTLCLLNGCFESHIKKDIYKKSRGTVLLDFFKYPTLNEFRDNYDFDGLEPFTLIIISSNQYKRLYELRWDEKQVFFKELDPTEGHIWSSATLYPKEIQARREEWFTCFLDNAKAKSQKDILNFHLNTSAGDLENGLIINRGSSMQTVSVTCFNVDTNRTKIYYNDLRNKKEYQYRILQMAIQDS